jgi:hypothetical protein
MRVRGPFTVWLLACLLITQHGLAEDASGPSLEFLEYLGSLVDDEGGWVGPEDMEEVVVTEDAQTMSDEEPEGSLVIP